MGFQKNRFDKNAQENGKWFEYDGAEFLLASAKSTAFQTAWAIQAEAAEEGDVDEDKAVKALSKVVLDWKNVADEDGETPLEFNQKDLEHIIKDDDLFSSWIMKTILDQDNYKRVKVAKKTKK